MNIYITRNNEESFLSFVAELYKRINSLNDSSVKPIIKGNLEEGSGYITLSSNAITHEIYSPLYSAIQRKSRVRDDQSVLLFAEFDPPFNNIRYHFLIRIFPNPQNLIIIPIHCSKSLEKTVIETLNNEPMIRKLNEKELEHFIAASKYRDN